MFEKSVAKAFFVTYRKFFHVFIVVYYIPVRSLWELYRRKISIALVIHSIDPIRSLDHSLSTHLIVQPNFISRLNDLEGRDSEIAPTETTRKLGYK